MNSTIELLSNRMSLRKYKEEKISREHLDIILEAAMRAPTAGNMMLYSIIAVEDEAKKKRLSETCDNQPFIANAPTILIFLADMQRWFDFYEHSGVKDYCKENNMDYEGPDEGDFLLATADAIIAAQNAVVAAEALGIGSCYIGDIIENYEIHREMLNLPDWATPVAMLCLGYYPENVERRINPRFNRKYIVFDESYKRLNGADFEDMFKDRQRLVSLSNVYKAKNYGQFIYARKTGAEFSKEMTRSVKVMLQKWTNK